ncbi:unnamed protein product [Prorocentrum cordatum]|uniref:Protochlorophyllide reductase n=1 Tax=Prorocentrum cordatum TaxID=2364126 RepID=A0ABN9WJU4_9DINO|nr:unnamed protein product [Polarella glacialis]
MGLGAATPAQPRAARATGDRPRPCCGCRCPAWLALVTATGALSVLLCALRRWQRGLDGAKLALFDQLFVLGFHLLRPLDGTRLGPGRGLEVEESLEGKVALVTGGTLGIGYYAAERFHAAGAHVIVSGRSASRCSEAAEFLREATGRGGRAEGLPLDLGCFDCVRNFSAALRGMFPRLDFMILNAGTSHAGDLADDDSAWLSPEGHSRVFQANHLGHFLLAVLLAPSLAPGGSVVVVGSSAMWMAHPSRLMLPKRNLTHNARHGDRWMRYGLGSYERSKLANRCFALSLRRRARARRVRVQGMTPGLVETRLTTGLEGDFARACVSPELAGLRLFECAFVSREFDFVAPHWQPPYVYRWDAPTTSPRWRRFRPRRPGTVFRAPALRESDGFPRRYNFEAPRKWLNRPQLHQRLDYSLHSATGPDCPDELQREFWRWSLEQVGLPASLDEGDIFAHTFT